MAINTKFTGFYNIPYNLWAYHQQENEWKDGMIFYLENEINVPENSTLGKDRVLYCTRSADIAVGDILFYNPDYQTNNIPKFVIVRPHTSNSGAARIEQETIDRIDISGIDTIPIGVCVLPAHFDPDGMTHFMYVNDIVPNNADRLFLPMISLVLGTMDNEEIGFPLNLLTKVEILNSKVGTGMYVPSVDLDIRVNNSQWRYIYEQYPHPSYTNSILSVYVLDCNKNYSNYQAGSNVLTLPYAFGHYVNGINTIYSYADNSINTLAWPYDEVLDGQASNFAYKSSLKSNFNDKSQYLNYDIDGYKNTYDLLTVFHLLARREKGDDIADDIEVLNSYDPIGHICNFKIPTVNENLQWYLPSIGELLHVACRCMTIQLSLLALQGQSIGTMMSKGVYYSSSLGRMPDVIVPFMLDTERGLIIMPDNRYNDINDIIKRAKVRPFIKLKF